MATTRKIINKDSFKPGEEGYAVLKFINVTIPGDERSRTHPGHGYPEYTETYTELWVFDTRRSLEEWVASSGRDNDYIVLNVRRPVITTRTVVDFD